MDGNQEPPKDDAAPDLRTMEELCQPTMQGRGGPIAPLNIAAIDFGLKHHMIQQVQNSCQFHGLPGDDANKHLDKFLAVTQCMKQTGVSDDALRLTLFPYSMTHHATAWFDRLPKNSIHSFEEMVAKFLAKYFPPSMVTKLRNDISNFRQLPDESLFEAWERYKLSIDRCPNHNMLLVTQIDTFYNGLTLRHRDILNAAAGGTFMKRRPEECFDLIENMTAHHNFWDSSAERDESCKSVTPASSDIMALTKKMDDLSTAMLRMSHTIQNIESHQVKAIHQTCETCGGPHSYSECPTTIGYTQENVYAAHGSYNQGGTSYQPQGDRNLLSYRSDNFLGPPGFTQNHNAQNRNQNQNQNRMNQGYQNQGNFNQNRNQGYQNQGSYNRNQGQNNFQGNSSHGHGNQNQGNYQNHGSNQNNRVQNFPNQPQAIVPINQYPTQAPPNQTQAIVPTGPIGNDTSKIDNFMKSQEEMNRLMIKQFATFGNQFSTVGNQIEDLKKSLNDRPSGSGKLPSNMIANPKGDAKAITTRSGMAYDGPIDPIPPPLYDVEKEPEVTTDKVQTPNSRSTAHVQPQVVPKQKIKPGVVFEPLVAPAEAPKSKTSIPYPSRLAEQKLREKASHQMDKFFQIFQELHFDISFADAIMLMPKFASTIKSLLSNKEKLFEMAKTPLNENCSAVLLKKFPEKLGDHGKFLIPCVFPGMVKCVALANLGASINLMPHSVWKKLSLPELTPTCMTLELADHSISHPLGIAEDVIVKVGEFHFPADFVVVDFDADQKVPLIVGRGFLRTCRALIDVFAQEITLRVGTEAITFNLDQTSRYSSNYDSESVNRIDVIDVATEEYSQEVLGYSHNSVSGDSTTSSHPIIADSSPSFTPFNGGDFSWEDVDAFLAHDSSLPDGVDNDYLDPAGDILMLGKIAK
jgi:hypothetical protein